MTLHMTETIQTAFSSLLYDWFAEHPIIFWLLTHPIITFFIVLVSLFLLWRLLNALGSLVDRLWLWILQSPLLVGKSLLRLGKKPGSRTHDIITTQLTEKEQLNLILTKLEAIEQKQQLIMEEIATLKHTNQVGLKERVLS
jgi:hypothetical protein